MVRNTDSGTTAGTSIYDDMPREELIELLKARDADPTDLEYLDLKIERMRRDTDEFAGRILQIDEFGILSKEEKEILKARREVDRLNAENKMKVFVEIKRKITGK